MGNHKKARNQKLPPQREVHFKHKMSFPNYIGTILRSSIDSYVLVGIFYADEGNN